MGRPSRQGLAAMSRVKVFETGHGLVLTWRRILMGRQPTKSVEDKARIVLAVLRGEVTIAEAGGRLGGVGVEVA